MLQQLHPTKVQREQGAEQQFWPVSANHQVWREWHHQYQHQHHPNLNQHRYLGGPHWILSHKD